MKCQALFSLKIIIKNPLAMFICMVQESRSVVYFICAYVSCNVAGFNPVHH